MDVRITLAGLAALGAVAAGAALTTDGPVRPSQQISATQPAPQVSQASPAPKRRSPSSSAPRTVSAIDFAKHAREADYAKGRPNAYTRWYARQGFARFYAARYGSFPTTDYLRGPWCSMFVVKLADEAGYKLVSKDALTSGMAADYRAKGRLKASPKLGDLAFFDWDGDATSVDEVDHVGIVTAITDGKVRVVEGNVNGGQSQETWRSRDFVMGYGR